MRIPTPAWQCVIDLTKIVDELLGHVVRREPLHPNAEAAMKNRLAEIVEHIETSEECESP